MNPNRNQICQYFLRGCCRYGNNCRLIHPGFNDNPGGNGMDVENTSNPNPSIPIVNPNTSTSNQNEDKLICIYFKQGKCTKGDKCYYFHGYTKTLKNLEKKQCQSEILQIVAFDKVNFITCELSSFSVWTIDPTFNLINTQQIEGRITKLLVSNGKVIIASQINSMYGFFSNFSFKHLKYMIII